MSKINKDNYLHELFINEAKPSLNRHSGSGGNNGGSEPVSSEYTDVGADIYVVMDGQCLTFEEFFAVMTGGEPSMSDVLRSHMVIFVRDDFPHMGITLNGWDSKPDMLLMVKKGDGTTYMYTRGSDDPWTPFTEQMDGWLDHGWIDKSALDALDYTDANNMGVYSVRTVRYPMVDGTLIDLVSNAETIGYGFSGYAFLNTVTLPNATVIGKSAFINCSSLTDVNMPTVRAIGEEAFRYCGSITKITLGDSLKYLGVSVFNNCSRLTDIDYAGTVEQWGLVTKESNWDTDTGDYTVHCADGDIAKDGTVSYHPTEDELLEGDGSEYYTMAPTALSFRSTEPLDELQEVQINGETVDPSNYTLEEGSTIVTFPIEYLKTLEKGGYEVSIVSKNKTVKGNFTVAAPELNEYGFYYNQPYTAYVEAFGGTTVFFIREGGTIDTIVLDTDYTETCNYTMNGTTITINAVAGTFTGTVSADNIYCNELYTTFVLGNTSIVSDSDYLYVYKEDLGGYEVIAIDKTKAEYGAIKTGINGIDTVKLADYVFYAYGNTQHMTVVPEMPDSVSIIGEHAFENCYSLMSAVIGNGVTSIGDVAFEECTGLTSVVLPDIVSSIGALAFSGCTSLTNITFEGTVAQWDAINFGYAWDAGVPATYVQCSDGQVAL